MGLWEHYLGGEERKMQAPFVAGTVMSIFLRITLFMFIMAPGGEALHPHLTAGKMRLWEAGRLAQDTLSLCTRSSELSMSSEICVVLKMWELMEDFWESAWGHNTFLWKETEVGHSKKHSCLDFIRLFFGCLLLFVLVLGFFVAIQDIQKQFPNSSNGYNHPAHSCIEWFKGYMRWWVKNCFPPIKMLYWHNAFYSGVNCRCI